MEIYGINLIKNHVSNICKPSWLQRKIFNLRDFERIQKLIRKNRKKKLDILYKKYDHAANANILIKAFKFLQSQIHDYDYIADLCTSS